jgi:signal peptidase I
MKHIDGRKAEITNPGCLFTTYESFAIKHGYPEAAAESDFTDRRKRPVSGDLVTLLVSGTHDSGYAGQVLWIVEAASGERFIISEKGLRILGEKVTVLKDEVLGVDREYREVKRLAKVGETVRVFGHRVTKANGIFTVDSLDRSDGHINYTVDGRNRYGTPYYDGDAYVVLEPTGIVRIKGSRYRLVEREAAEGDLVIVTKVSAGYAFFTVGDVGRVISSRYGAVYVNFNGQGNSHVYEHGEWSVGKSDGNSAYAVLEVLTPAAAPTSEPTPASESEIALLQRQVGDLFARVTKLELDVKVAREDIVLVEEGVAADIERLKPKLPESKVTRDELVARAKADVEKLSTARTRNVPVNGSATKAIFNLGPGQDYVDFVVDRVKRTVVALLRTTRGDTVWARGIAKAAPGDCFNVHIGKAIALRRALALTIPAEYVNAPQPTEPCVGDVLSNGRTVYAVRPTHRTVGEGAGFSFVNANRGLTYLDDSGYEWWNSIDCVRVVDDSRDGAYEDAKAVAA